MTRMRTVDRERAAARWPLTSRIYRFLDGKDATSLEHKLDSFSSVYRRLTGKDVVFEFPVQAQD